MERPQHMLMRVSLGVHVGDLPAAIETYRLMSRRTFTHASPTLFNAGTPMPQMSSCFLLKMQEPWGRLPCRFLVGGSSDMVVRRLSAGRGGREVC